MTDKAIVHLDMDAFFASVEQRCNPGLRGRPIAVIGSGARTVVTTSSYEARAWGVKTGMNVFETKKLCPEIIFVEGNNTKYTDTCAEFVALCRRFTPEVEVFSVDEVFLDVTGSLKLFGPARNIVLAIKKKLRNNFGLTCSAGIAPNKLLAKLASGLEKPDGLVEIAPQEVRQFLEHLPVSQLCGIGSKLTSKLAALGIHTCGDLGRASPSVLRSRFGIIGEMLQRIGRGEDGDTVVTLEKTPAAKSIGHSMTFNQDIMQRELLEVYLLQLAEMVGRRVRSGGFCGRTVALTVRYKDFTTFTKRLSVREPIRQSHAIYSVAKQIIDSIRLRQAVRLLGVSLCNLIRVPGQIPLFAEERRWQEVTRAMDAINNKFGSFVLTWGSLLARYNHAGVISPAWRPEGTRRTEFKRLGSK